MNKIYVGNLPYSVDEQGVAELFQQFGEIEETILIRDRETNRLKGFGFIVFASQEAAQNALSLDGQDFEGRPLRVNIAKEREKRSGGNGGGRGGRRW